jgi:hypothetical protein
MRTLTSYKVALFSAATREMDIRVKYGEKSEEYRQAVIVTDAARDALRKAWTEDKYEGMVR